VFAIEERSPPVAAWLAAGGEVRDEVLLGDRLRFSGPHGLLHQRAGSSHSEAAAPATVRGDKGTRPRRRRQHRRRWNQGAGRRRRHAESTEQNEGDRAADGCTPAGTVERGS